ncbi:calcium channel flower-like [Clytia hemisphaerica]|uniref:Calcium channel flower n=1 Tax=Clytia hemisphaerica TaxID=252671 RepID=A0A7M5X6E8_9CNID|eukprot:TCONS_00050349-protein
MPNSPQKKGSPTPAESAPRILRFLVRIWGVVAGLCMLSTGLFAMITITGKCFVSGIIQIVFGLLVLCLEAPMLCQFSEIATKLSDWVESHFRFWLRAALYLLAGVPPIVMCLELSTFIGSGSCVVLAALYGTLAIGRKGGDVEKKSNDDVEMKATLMDNQGDPNDIGGAFH